MMSNIADNIVKLVRELYKKDKNAKALFDWAASRERDAGESRIDLISYRTGIERDEARALARQLAEMGCCEFIVGRRGAKSRVRWKYSLTGLGIAARGEANSLEVVNPDSIDLEFDAEADEPLTIPEAKRRLAATLDIEPGAIEIIVKG
jgi:hypothetical protein